MKTNLLVFGLIILNEMWSATFFCAAGEQNTNRPEAQQAILELLPGEPPQPNYDSPVPKQVSGHVLIHHANGTSPAENVSVTDGYTVVKTDEQGAYSLNPNPYAVFVYLTRPSGFDVKGDWYKPLSSKVNFALQAADQDEDEYIFIHVTDTHVSQNPRSLAGLSNFVREVNRMTPQPRFVVNSGDLLDLSKALVTSPSVGHANMQQYVGIMNHLNMPHYNVSGDHTDSSYRLDQFPRGDIRCGKALYWEYLGPQFFSFEYGKIHFVSVDFGYHLGLLQRQVQGKMLEYPTNEVQTAHVEWMKQDMAHRIDGSYVITTSEADLGHHCPGFIEIAEQHDVRLQLVGDLHVVAHKPRFVPYRIGGALAGCWWNPKAEQLCPDLSPQGYMIYQVVGEKVEQFYKGLGQRVAIVSPRIGKPLQGQVEIDAHLVQPQQGEILEYSLDGEKWMPMQETGRPFYRVIYRAVVDSTSLPDGLFKFHVRCTSGEVRTREFVVVNQNDSSAFNSDASLTFSVGTETGWTKHKAPSGKVEVLLNQQVIGVLKPNIRKKYSFDIDASLLHTANVLSFHFEEPGDGMSMSSPVLKMQDAEIYDPRDSAIRRIRTAHWGQDSDNWGGYIVGEAAPPDETPFHRKQNKFCFMLEMVP